MNIKEALMRTKKVVRRFFAMVIVMTLMPVSYTHLDVYKRQVVSFTNDGKYH